MRPSTKLSRTVLRGLLAGALLQFVTSPLLAGKATFDPRIELAWRYTDNVRYVESGEEVSDVATTVRATLPWERQMRHSSLLFQYRIAASKYDDFSSLDNLENRLFAEYNVRTSRVSSILLKAYYNSTQDQANPVILEASEDPDPFLSVRTKRESYDLSLGYRREFGRWDWSSVIGARRNDHSLIGDFDPQGDPALIPEDKQGYHATTGFNRELSKKVTIGADYTFSITDLERNGQDELQRLRFTFRTVVSKRLAVLGTAGGYRRHNEARGDPTSGGDFSLGLRFNSGDGVAVGPVKFDFGLAVSPSYGGSLEGTSSNRAIFVSMSGVREDPVSWKIVARHAERVPELFTQVSVLDSDSLSARVRVSFYRGLGFSVSARYVKQTSDDPLEPPASFYVASAGLVWRPLRGTRIAER